MFSRLFFTFFKMGLFTFGGGYAMIPIMERELIQSSQLVSKEEFLDDIAIAQSFPGPIAVNLSILLGYHLHGLPGALSALAGVTLPSFSIILFVSLIYERIRGSIVVEGFFQGIYPVIPALLILSFLRLFSAQKKTIITLLCLIITFVGVTFLNLNPIYFIAGGVIVGLCSYTFRSF